MSEPNIAPSDSERLTTLITEHQRELYLYIWSLVHRSNDTQDILQETNLALWRDMARSSRVDDFRSWACRVAYNQVLAYRKRCARDRLHFDDALLGQMAKESEHQGEQASQWQLALRSCSRKLPAESRQMLVFRYRSPCSVRAIADQLGRSVASVSQSLYRIRAVLLQCIRETVATGVLNSGDLYSDDLRLDAPRPDNTELEERP